MKTNRPFYIFIVVAIVYAAFFIGNIPSGGIISTASELIMVKTFIGMFFAGIILATFASLMSIREWVGQPIKADFLMPGARFRVLAYHCISVSDKAVANKEQEYIFLLLVENLDTLDTSIKVDANRIHYVHLTSEQVEDSSVFRGTDIDGTEATYVYSGGKVRKIKTIKTA